MNPLDKIAGTIISGLVISIIIVLSINVSTGVGATISISTWVHVAAGVAWIDLLYYFNFVQVPSIGEANADEGGPGPAAITKYIAPRALLWFRWAALLTWLSGATILYANGGMDGIRSAFELGLVGTPVNPEYNMIIGIGAWMGTIMLSMSGFLFGLIRKKFWALLKLLQKKKQKEQELLF